MKEKDKKRDLYCNFEYFMKHGCRGCKLGRRCEEWDRDRLERDSISNDIDNNSSCNKTEKVNGNEV